MKFYDFINNFEYVNDGVGKFTQIDGLNKEQLLIGIAVELEHTKNFNCAASIAIDHLTENKKYYTILINSGLVDEENALMLAKRFILNNNPEDSAQANAASDVEMTDRLLGYEPKNVGDEI